MTLGYRDLQTTSGAPRIRGGLRTRLSAWWLACALALVSGLSLVSASPARADEGPAACQAEGKVYIYVEGVTTGCKTAVKNGVTAINSVARTSWSSDGLLLQINDKPASPDTQTKGYWSYWIWEGGNWSYAQVGPYLDKNLAGKVRAWKYIGLASADRVAPSWRPAAAAKPTSHPTSKATTKPTSGKSEGSSKSGSTSGSKSKAGSGSQGSSKSGSQSSQGQSSGRETSSGGSGATASSSSHGSAEAQRPSAHSSGQASGASAQASGHASASPSSSVPDSTSDAARRLAGDAPTGATSGDSSDDSGSSGGSGPLIASAAVVAAAVAGAIVVVRRRRH